MFRSIAKTAFSTRVCSATLTAKAFSTTAAPRTAKTHIVGTVVTDITQGVARNESPFARLRIAVNDYFDKNAQQQVSSYFTVFAYGDDVARLVNTVHKGDLVGILASTRVLRLPDETGAPGPDQVQFRLDQFDVYRRKKREE